MFVLDFWIPSFYFCKVRGQFGVKLVFIVFGNQNNCEFMKKFVFLILILSSFSGCITEKKCRDRFPLQMQTIVKDTLIVTSSRTFDTLIQDVGKDTVFIRDIKTRIETKLVRVNDSIFVSTKCPSDTVRVEKVIQTFSNNVKNVFDWFPVVLAIIGTTIVFFVFTLFLKRK